MLVVALLLTAAYLVPGIFWAGVYFGLLWIQRHDAGFTPSGWAKILLKALLLWPVVWRVFLEPEADVET